MRPSADKASATGGRGATLLDRARGAEAAVPSRRVLVEQVRVLRPAAFAEVLDLHDLREHRDVNGRLGRLGVVVPLEYLFILN